MINKLYSNKWRNGSRFGYFLRLVVMISCILEVMQSKEMILMDLLQKSSDIIQMKLFQQIHSYIQTSREIGQTQYTCKSVFKNQLTKNQIEIIQDLKISIDYPKSIFMQGPILPTFTEQQTKRIQAVDKIVDLLKGKCLYYSTYTFIYQYCHKQHVRQFDNHQTFTNNAKPEYQDISMGVFDPQTYNQKRIKWAGPPKTPQEQKRTLPIRFDDIFVEEYKIMKVESLVPQFGKVELQQNQNGQLLHSNVHLFPSDNYINLHPVLVQLTCEEYTNNVRKQIQNYAILATAYDLIYTLKNDKCTRLVSHKQLRLDYYPESYERLRVYGKYLYGNVQQICTENWAWEKEKQEGSLIYIQGYTYEKIPQHHYLTIKKVINDQLIQLDYPLGRSFNINSQNQIYFSYSTLKSTRILKNITRCNILFNKKLRFEDKISSPIILPNQIIKFTQQQPIIAQTHNIGCICQLELQSNSVRIVDLDIQLGPTPFKNYYQAYFKTNTNIVNSQMVKKLLLLTCKLEMCFAFREDRKQVEVSEVSEVGKGRRFTRMLKLSKQSEKMFKFNQTNLQNIYIIKIKGNGILRLITKGNKGQTYTYLITQGQIIKIRTFSNGTKQVIKQNKYYQNMTSVPSNLKDNYIYFKISKLKNNRYYGGIWKYSDYIYFPRFQLVDEVALDIEVVSGYGYLRILDARQMVKKQSLAIFQYFKKIEQIYNIKSQTQTSNNQKTQNTQNYFNHSYKLNYEYVSGKYCDQPVNAFRKTIVHFKCGPSWFTILKINEKSPCNYYIEIETKLLCRQGFKWVTEEDESILNGVSLNNGVICHPKIGFYDQTFPYFHLPYKS